MSTVAYSHSQMPRLLREAARRTHAQARAQRRAREGSSPQRKIDNNYLAETGTSGGGHWRKSAAGAPRGNRNALKTGRHTAEMKALLAGARRTIVRLNFAVARAKLIMLMQPERFRPACKVIRVPAPLDPAPGERSSHASSPAGGELNPPKQRGSAGGSVGTAANSGAGGPGSLLAVGRSCATAARSARRRVAWRRYRAGEDGRSAGAGPPASPSIARSSPRCAPAQTAP
jgi:hypothetical protein